MRISKQAFIGIDIGGTKTLAVLFDDKFKVVDKRRFRTDPKRGDHVFERRLSRVLNELLETTAARNQRVAATGIGCSGSVAFDSSELRISPHIPFLKNFPLTAKVSKWTGTKVFLGNDVQMGLFGEHRLGAARDQKHVIGIFIGTGIGGALIIDGKLHRGERGVAGDIGHYLAQPLGIVSGLGKQGTLDNLASRTAIAAEAAMYASRQWAPNLLEMGGTDLALIRSRTLARAIKAGDKRIEELVANRMRMLGIILSNLVDFINPGMVVLGGGLADEMPDLVLKYVRAGIEEYSTSDAAKGLKVALTKLREYAVAAGAARMAFEVYGAEKPKKT